ncbi:uncharacterized protein L969DRAFT_94207 [Mixia osmundae IAM 14324]|uniref:SANT domain-containing protein n=1 Tax=Mixia osmundae (strain CBS 9802 / IAM 14324 / JCM 22182 / KY 12970) TaxID=764103 RepID=G7E6H1_MIXOS|nr:uncharacterized protein L969DRAFT_94207 [Mixia osmundae IAM 14324]KEI40412.1 hypothetical protein L969DRAFT_94207 [Mixia osmundae IAM 14324]GAA98431.1 hypothetical protein E5Q_05117 [Mixia osmundae IAM 14324]
MYGQASRSAGPPRQRDQQDRSEPPLRHSLGNRPQQGYYSSAAGQSPSPSAAHAYRQQQQDSYGYAQDAHYGSPSQTADLRSSYPGHANSSRYRSASWSAAAPSRPSASYSRHHQAGYPPSSQPLSYSSARELADHRADYAIDHPVHSRSPSMNMGQSRSGSRSPPYMSRAPDVYHEPRYDTNRQAATSQAGFIRAKPPAGGGLAHAAALVSKWTQKFHGANGAQHEPASPYTRREDQVSLRPQADDHPADRYLPAKQYRNHAMSPSNSTPMPAYSGHGHAGAYTHRAQQAQAQENLQASTNSPEHSPQRPAYSRKRRSSSLGTADVDGQMAARHPQGDHRSTQQLLDTDSKIDLLGPSEDTFADEDGELIDEAADRTSRSPIVQTPSPRVLTAKLPAAQQNNLADAPMEDELVGAPEPVVHKTLAQLLRLSLTSSQVQQQEDAVVQSLLASQRDCSDPASAPYHAMQTRPPLQHDIANLPFMKTDKQAHYILRDALLEGLSRRMRRRCLQINSLRGDYKQLNKSWKSHCVRMEKHKVPLQNTRGNLVAPALASAAVADSVPSTVEAAPILGTPLSAGGRANRRANAALSSSFGYGDAARSEAEFLEILASLEHADMRDPTLRASRTTAVVPDMALSSTEMGFLSLIDENALVIDPIAFYGIRDPGPVWSPDEERIFAQNYAVFPKQFGKIAACLPDKTTQQCVLYYYRAKRFVDFRALTDRRARDGRKRKLKRRDRGATTKGTSLLAGLGRSRADEEEDEDSPPPSPEVRKESAANMPLHEAPAAAAMLRRAIKAAEEESLAAFSEAPSSTTATIESGVAAKDAGIGKKRRGKTARSDVASSAAERLNSKRKGPTSSYWSVAERNEFLRLLAIHGKNYKRIALDIENKTAVQCKNFFQNNYKKLNLQEIADEATGEEVDDGEALDLQDDTVEMSTEQTTPREGLDTGPQTGYFESHAPRQLRDLLNDAEDQAPNQSSAGWFGDDGDSVATEEDDQQERAERVRDERLAQQQQQQQQPPHQRQQMHVQAPYHRQEPVRTQSYQHPPYQLGQEREYEASLHAQQTAYQRRSGQYDAYDRDMPWPASRPSSQMPGWQGYGRAQMYERPPAPYESPRWSGRADQPPAGYYDRKPAYPSEPLPPPARHQQQTQHHQHHQQHDHHQHQQQARYSDRSYY